MASDLHKGHRERVRKDFLEHGFPDDIPSHQILEMLLFFAIPQGDTNATAHRLLNEFGSVAGVFEAEVSELLRVEGIGRNSASLIKLMIPLFKRYKSDKAVIKPKYTNMDDVCGYLISKFFGFKNEVFMIMSFDNEGYMLACDQVYEGDMSTVGVPIRDIVKVILKRNAACVMLAHNHISGTALPSKNDVLMTKSLKVILAQMGVNLLDHVIVFQDDAISMRQSVDYRDIFN